MASAVAALREIVLESVMVTLCIMSADTVCLVLLAEMQILDRIDVVLAGQFLATDRPGIAMAHVMALLTTINVENVLVRK